MSIVRPEKHHIKYFLLIGLSITAVLIWTAVFGQAADNNLKVYFFDVGQGSAIFIEAPNKNQILIDGGPDETIVAKLGEVMPFYDRSIDLLILTHPDADHLNGLIEVLRRYEVKQVLETGVSDSSTAYQVWHNLIAEKKIPVTIAQAGEKIKIAGGIEMDVLYPLFSLKDKTLSDTNGGSIVSRLVYGQDSFLFTGDADQKIEWQMISFGSNLDSDVLGVAHHGSKNSTSESFLAKVTPEAAIIQVGQNNKYGHPSQEILQKLKNIIMLRTDINNDVKLKSDGKNISYH